MKRWHCLWGLWLALCWLLPAALAAAEPAYGPLFTFSKQGRTHYLYGTMHVGRPGSDAPDWGLKQAMAQSEALVLELDVDAPDAPAEVLALARRGAAKQWRQLDTDSRRLLLAQLRRIDVERAQAQSLAPAMWLMQLALNDYQRLGQLTQEGSEAMLRQMARRERRPVLALETTDEQGRMLFEMPAPALREWVRQTADWEDKPEAERYYRELIAAWERGDLEALQAMVALPGYPRLSAWTQREMLDRRNLTMARRIDELTSSRRLLVAVGALHLAGSQGLVKLLGQRGYLVRPAPRAP
ncbi:TraB/GumN family protein [Chromobacterium haemolyticum]|uniref:TraB/GumN family protein n=1 Tax=Chromobacterium fluminis TaxID=3044269 RepID=A0ABX0L223_9NEIS|nr:TraB/GumN family protein [Chromobacterium haemolyticum]NHR05003.1 TraB/GumN family protein [Chromobacterium haemolyticum]